MWSNPKNYDSNSTDAKFIAFLESYIYTNNLVMYTPKLTYTGLVTEKDKSLPKYSLSSYTQENILDDKEKRRNFFELFLSGAHFVVIHSASDTTKKISDFRAEVESNLKTSYAFLHSHYAKVAASFGLIYPYAIKEPRTIINSFLTNHTAHKNPNSFFQLEGWPLYKTPYSKSTRDASRHGADYQAHVDSKWNISTYAASVYSEKRGTTVFLAPDDWAPSPSETTIMPSFVGAETLQSWLDTSLIDADIAREG